MIIPTDLPFMGFSQRKNNDAMNAALNKLQRQAPSENDESFCTRTICMLAIIIRKVIDVMYIVVVVVAVFLVCYYFIMLSADDTRQLPNDRPEIKYCGFFGEDQPKCWHKLEKWHTQCICPRNEYCLEDKQCDNKPCPNICQRNCDRFEGIKANKTGEQQGFHELCACGKGFIALLGFKESCDINQICTPGELTKKRYCKPKDTINKVKFHTKNTTVYVEQYYIIAPKVKKNEIEKLDCGLIQDSNNTTAIRECSDGYSCGEKSKGTQLRYCYINCDNKAYIQGTM